MQARCLIFFSVGIPKVEKVAKTWSHWLRLCTEGNCGHENLSDRGGEGRESVLDERDLSFGIFFENDL